MKLSLNWLNDFVDLSGLTTEEIEKQMVKCGFEVEAVDKLSSGTNLIVGEVVECKDHPNSDHLHCCTVDCGEGEVKGNTYVGGISGYCNNSCTIRYCFNIGNITGSSSVVAGISGVYGNIAYCFNTGKITGAQDVGVKLNGEEGAVI